MSGSGLLFPADREYPLGAKLEVSVIPDQAVAPPLEAVVEVVRVSYSEADEKYAIAGEMKGRSASR